MTFVTADRDFPPTRYQRWMASSPRRAKVVFVAVASSFIALATFESVAYGDHGAWWGAVAITASMCAQWSLIGSACQHVRQYDERHREAPPTALHDR